MVSPAVAPILTLIGTVSVGMVAVAVGACSLARHYGGMSRHKRKLIFSLASAAGLSVITLYVYVRLT